jgi:predicted RNA-binding Zn-ribbon protein involved in translation (DUF1610 family)
VTGDSSAFLCPKCRNRMLWNGMTYRCIACDHSVAPKDAKKKGKRPRKK